MIVSIVKTWLEVRCTIKTPQCINCRKTMRHSCTHRETSEFEQRVYECVGCRSTQSFVTAVTGTFVEPRSATHPNSAR
jgi:hypothetical protein